MKDIHKSAVWSLASVPITIFAFNASFALAHGSLMFMIPLLIPGLLALWLLGENNYPEWLVVSLCIVVQYFSYFLVIHGIKKIIWYFKNGREQNTLLGKRKS